MVEAGLIKADEDEDLDLDPLDDGDFVVILARLSYELERAAERQEALSLTEFLDRLDVDWAALSPAAADRIVEGAAAVIAGAADTVVPRASRIFAEAARSIIPATKLATIQRDGLEIGSSLSMADKETGKALLRQQSLYVRDEFGRRAEAAAERARGIVARGLERGLGREEMGAQLAKDVTLSQLARSRSYWEMIATAFSNRARTATQLNSYEEAEIVTYKFVAVLDGRTSDICRYMDGKTWTVRSAVALQRRAEKLRNADDIKDLMPWVFRGREGDRDILYYEKKGRRHRVAYIDESAVGRNDEVGVFSDGMSDAALEAAGIMVPPLHPNCRSTIVTEG